MSQENAWANDTDINVENFLKFITQHVHVKHISQLGIRIKAEYLARYVS